MQDYIRLILAQKASMRLQEYVGSLRANITRGREHLDDLNLEVPENLTIEMARKFVNSTHCKRLGLHPANLFVAGHGLRELFVEWLTEQQQEEES